MSTAQEAELGAPEAQDVPGSVAWVTGGSAGIGRATAALLERRGAKVGVLDVSTPDGGLPHALCDVADSSSVTEATGELASRTGWPDILVCSAGVSHSSPVHELSDADWQRVLGVNLTGAFHVMRACLPHMLEQRHGRIVNVSSAGAVRVRTERAAYAASKAGLIALTKVAALESATSGVTANVVAPGLTDTGLAAGLYGSRDGVQDATRQSFIANPMGVMLDPDEIAEAIAFLCAPSSRHITGHVLHVNAGAVM